MLRAKLKLHKIAPNAQGIRHNDVMISGEVQSLALPLILKRLSRQIGRQCEAAERTDISTNSGIGPKWS